MTGRSHASVHFNIITLATSGHPVPNRWNQVITDYQARKPMHKMQTKNPSLVYLRSLGLTKRAPTNDR